MKFEPFTFKDFPSYDEPIEGVIDVNGDVDNLRCRMVDVTYQRDRIIRFLIPQKLQEGEAPWGGALDEADSSFPETMDRFPLIVHVQGSGWLTQNMHDHVLDLAQLAYHGYAVAIVQYQEAPGCQFPQQVIDTKRALRYIAAHVHELPIDLNHLYLSGDSSGGHTMLLTYLTYRTGELDDPGAGPLPALCGGLDFYGVTDFNTFDDWWLRDSLAESPNMQALLGDECVKHEVREAASPVHFVKEGLDLVPLLIIHGSKDTVVPFTQSLEIYRTLKGCGYDASLMRVKGADHGGAVFYSEPVYREILRFLKEHGDKT